jgi:hypothetical protein
MINLSLPMVRNAGIIFIVKEDGESIHLVKKPVDAA